MQDLAAQNGAKRGRVGAGVLLSLLLGLGLEACATTSRDASLPRPATGSAVRGAPKQVWASAPLQCVPYARQRSGILLFGDAHTWPGQAEGRYALSSRPQVGSVMVLGGTRGGHVAYVSAVLSDREILVDHANWANDGAIHLQAPVRDVSPRNDWSEVRVWHMGSGQLGSRAYPVRTFIAPP